MPAYETALNYSGSYGLPALVAVSVLSRNGQHGEGVLKKPRTDLATRPPHVPSFV